MLLKPITHLSILSKALLYFTLVAGILIAAYIHTVFIKSEYDKCQNAYTQAVGMHEKSLQINLATIMVVRNEKGARGHLQQLITDYEESFKLLKNGGDYYEGNQKFSVKKLEIGYEDEINTLNRLWTSYKSNAGRIYMKEGSLAFDGTRTIYIDGNDDLLRSVASQVLPKDIASSIAFLDSNAYTFIKNNRSIVEKLKKEKEASYTKFNLWLRSYEAGVVLLLVIGFILFRVTVYKRIARLKFVSSMIEAGNLNQDIEKSTPDEIGKIAKSISRLTVNLRKIIEFIDKVGGGDFSADYELKGEDDHLGLSLLNMKDTLHKAEEENIKRRADEEIRNWATRGVAQFSEQLRLYNDDMKELSFNIISNLIKFIGANQGGLFILNEDERAKDEDPFFELAASYAYDRRKYMTRKVMWDEGLIGRVAQERESLYLTDIPDDYIAISSGLGKSKPTCILISPLMYNGEVYGVVELASFELIEQYKIDFVEKISESIASTISNVRINMKTAKLLDESKDQSERLAQQEEELRQSMEEMHATQEEIQRKNSLLEQNERDIAQKAEGLEFESMLFDTLMDTLQARVTFKDAEAKYIRVNKAKLNALGLNSQQELLGLTDYDIFGDSHDEAFVLKEVENIANGITVENKKEFIQFKDGRELWGSTTRVPLKDKEGRFIGCLVMTFDVTEQENATFEVQMFRNVINTIYNNLDLIYYQLDKDLNFIEIAGRGSRLLGLDSDGHLEEQYKTMFPEWMVQLKDVEEKGVIERDGVVEVSGGELPIRHVVYSNRATTGGFFGVTFIGNVANADKITDLDYMSVYEVSHVLIEWGPDYKIGLDLIDSQHEVLIDLINQLYSAFVDGTTSMVLGTILQKLVDYTEFHFGEEEHIFAEIGYQEQESHVEKHRSFVDKINKYKADFDKGEFTVGQSLLDFLKDWLVEHILKTDVKYVDEFKKHDIK